MGREVRLARRRPAPIPTTHASGGARRVTYLAVVLIIAALLEAFTPFPALTWLGNENRIMGGLSSGSSRFENGPLPSLPFPCTSDRQALPRARSCQRILQHGRARPTSWCSS
jgi:hypothetical protein